jgi:hypothetical protein
MIIISSLPFSLIQIQADIADAPIVVGLGDRRGIASLDLDEYYLNESRGREASSLFLRVFQGERCIASVERIFEWNPVRGETRLHIPEADKPLAYRPAPYAIRGRVHAVRSLDGFVLQAFDQPLRGESIPMGTATLSDGTFDLRYPAKLLDGGKLHADLLLVLVDANGVERWRSEIIPKAPPTFVTDVVLDADALADPTTFAELRDALAGPVGRTPVSTLTPAEVDQLAVNLTLDAKLLSLFVQAHALAAALGPANPRQRVSEELCFGLLTQGVAPRPGMVLSLRATAMRAHLEAAAAAGHITRDPTALRVALAALQVASGGSALVDDGRGPRTLLAAGGLAPVTVNTITRAWSAWEGDDEAAFWRSLPASAVVPADVERAQLALRLGALTGGHAPLVTALSSKVKAPRQLATLSRDEWRALVDRTGVPEDFEPKGTDRTTAYATKLADEVEAAFPTATLVAAVRRRPEAARSPLVAFCEANPDFELGVTSLRGYLRAHPAARESLGAEPRAAVAAVQRTARVFRLTHGADRSRQALALLDAGLGSSQAIARHGRRSFIRKHAAALGGREAAVTVHAKAVAVATHAHLAAAALRPGAAPWAVGLPGVRPAASVSPELDADTALGLADMTTLFGNNDLCACTHCASALSPAAYLVDVLSFLDSHHNEPDDDNAPEPPSWYEGLATRRPDIPNIALTCSNTHTELPYIDLVNEVLEAATIGAVDSARQTTWTAQDLALHPEHLEREAYDNTRTARFPWTLPFDLNLAETRAYLPLVGVDRRALIATLAADPTQPPSLAVRQALAIEACGTSPAELAVIADDAPALIAWGADTVEPTAAAQWPLETWIGRARMSYAGFSEVLRAAWVNPPKDGWRLAVVFAGGSCSLAEARLGAEPADGVLPAAVVSRVAEVMARFARFVRLQRRLGWTAFELDEALVALAPDLGMADGVSAGFVRLAELELLRRVVKLPVVELLAWFVPLGIHPAAAGEHSLYDRRFRSAPPPSPDPLALDDVGEIAGSPRALESEADAVIAGLRCSASDFAMLLASTGLAPIDGTPLLTRDNLSRLHRAVALARVLKLTIPRYLVLRGLSDVDPFAGPDAALQFVEEARRAVAAPLAPEAVMALLVPAEADDTGPRIAELLGRVRAQRIDTAAETALVADPDGHVLAALLTAVLPGSGDTPREVAVAELLALAAGPATPEALAAWHATGVQAWQRLCAVDGMARLPADIADTLLVPAWTPAAQTRGEWVQAEILAVRRQSTATARVLDALATGLGLPPDVAEALTRRTDALTPLLAPNLADPTLALLADDGSVAALWSAQADVLRRMIVATPVLLALDATRDELPLLYAPAVPTGWLDVADPGASGYTAWVRLRELYRLRAALGGKTGPLFELLTRACASAPDDAFIVDTQQVLVTRLGWSVTDLEAAIDLAGVGLSSREAWRDERRWTALVQVMTLARTTGVGLNTLETWATGVPDGGSVISVRTAARARHAEAQWPAIAAPVRDALREQQRTALVGWLCDRLKHEGTVLHDERDLYRHFLIDIEMCGCARTSRVREALSAAQLYVQQGSLGIGTRLDMPLEVQRQWAWSSRYRVWEANRKVFLWPENWMEPELRDDKSPLYEALESALLQGEVDDVAAEKAFRGYLEGLDELARLEVKASTHERMPEGVTNPADLAVDRLHVVARTRSLPHRWFHRTREHGVWRPWHRMDVEIEGDHQVLVVWNRRVWLIWAVFSERAAADQPAPDSDKPTPTRMDLEVKLAWSVLTTEGWSAKRMTPMVVRKFRGGFAAVRDVRLICSVDDRSGDLLVGVDIEGGVPCLQFSSADGSVSVPLGLGLRINVAGPAPSVPYSLQPAIYRQSYCQVRLAEIHLSSLVNDWDFDSERPVVMPPLPWAITPLLPTRPTYSTPTFPTLFLEDPRRSFVVDPRPSGVVLLKQAVYFDQLPRDKRVARSSMSRRRDVPVFKVGQLVRGGVDLAGLYAPSVKPDASSDLLDIQALLQVPRWTIEFRRDFHLAPFYHPHVKLFLRQFNRHGLDGLLAPAPDGDDPTDERRYLLRQGQGINLPPSQWTFDGDEGYQPTARVVGPYPREDIDFEPGGAYSLYNWELFFHAPLAIAIKLKQNHRFADAMRWFHYIFDPTAAPRRDEPTPQRFWRVKPLFATYFADEAADPDANIHDVMAMFSGEGTDTIGLANVVRGQIDAWRQNPFNPYAIGRLRWSAFQKTVVRKYIDNLIAWGDSLYRIDTLESVNEATLLYVLAAELLGRRPETIETRAPTPQTFASLRNKLDEFSNAIVTTFEDELTDMPSTAWDDAPPIVSPSLYFCIPRNDAMAALWDTVEDRLYKIRHCLNIDGAARRLALFDPPIDPAALVRAAAGGNLGSVLTALGSPTPQHRYVVLAQKARELCGEVRSFGAALLAALEKRDAESLALLRQSHELALLELVKQVRKAQVDDARLGVTALEQSKVVIERRYKHYDDLQKEGLTAGEAIQLVSLAVGGMMRMASQAAQVTGGGTSVIPDFVTGSAGMGASPVIIAIAGGALASRSSNHGAEAFAMLGAYADLLATMTGLMAGHERRDQEWRFQADLATLELAQIDTQIASASTRVAIAERELANHERQMEQSREVDEFLRTKFTGRPLYDWMVGQLSAAYVQIYQLALEMGRRAERAWIHEVAPADAVAFVGAGAWDDLKKGLLAGERLALDLTRMDVAYLDQARRELELTRHLSLSQIDPVALQVFKSSGTCEFVLPEWLFDLDCPGHYLRRIKSVALSIPCVAGPYTPVHASLTLTQSAVRRAGTLTDGQYAAASPENPELAYEYAVAGPIVTSQGQADSGLFEVQLRDERYLPFEGRGVVESRWRVELPAGFRAFDYAAISDLVLHLRYTARDGGVVFRNSVEAALTARLQAAADNAVEASTAMQLARVIPLRNEGASEWVHLLRSDSHRMKVRVTQDRFPHALRSRGEIVIQRFELFTFGLRPGGQEQDPACQLSCLEHESQASTPRMVILQRTAIGAGDRWSEQTTEALEPMPTGVYELHLSAEPSTLNLLQDAYLIVHYGLLLG